MKQFQLLRANGDVRGPFKEDVALHFQTGYDDRQTLSGLEVGFSMRDGDGDLWTRLPDLILQDDTPMTETDVAACRASASRIRQSLRLERIATAALQGIMGAPAGHPLTAESIASCAVRHAKALIAELDKQA